MTTAGSPSRAGSSRPQARSWSRSVGRGRSVSRSWRRRWIAIRAFVIACRFGFVRISRLRPIRIARLRWIGPGWSGLRLRCATRRGSLGTGRALNRRIDRVRGRVRRRGPATTAITAAVGSTVAAGFAGPPATTTGRLGLRRRLRLRLDRWELLLRRLGLLGRPGLLIRGLLGRLGLRRLGQGDGVAASAVGGLNLGDRLLGRALGAPGERTERPHPDETEAGQATDARDRSGGQRDRGARMRPQRHSAADTCGSSRHGALPPSPAGVSWRRPATLTSVLSVTRRFGQWNRNCGASHCQSIRTLRVRRAVGSTCA